MQDHTDLRSIWKESVRDMVQARFAENLAIAERFIQEHPELRTLWTLDETIECLECARDIMGGDHVPEGTQYLQDTLYRFDWNLLPARHLESLPFWVWIFRWLRRDKQQQRANRKYQEEHREELNQYNREREREFREYRKARKISKEAGRTNLETT